MYSHGVRLAIAAPAQIFVIVAAVLGCTNAAAAALSSASRVGFTGIGPIVIGTTPAQAAATGTPLRTTVAAPGSSCHYLHASTPAGIAFMVENGTIRRTEVSSSAIASTDGFRIGDARAKLLAAYGSRARLAPDKYDPNAQSMTIVPPAGADKFRLVYRLRRGIVRRIDAGALPQIAYVEGCS